MVQALFRRTIPVGSASSELHLHQTTSHGLTGHVVPHAIVLSTSSTRFTSGTQILPKLCNAQHDIAKVGHVLVSGLSHEHRYRPEQTYPSRPIRTPAVFGLTDCLILNKVQVLARLDSQHYQRSLPFCAC